MGQESLLEAELTAEVTDMKHGRITIRQNRAIGIPKCFFIGVSKESFRKQHILDYPNFGEIHSLSPGMNLGILKGLFQLRGYWLNVDPRLADTMPVSVGIVRTLIRKKIVLRL
jgi:hypothetical protein